MAEMLWIKIRFQTDLNVAVRLQEIRKHVINVQHQENCKTLVITFMTFCIMVKFKTILQFHSKKNVTLGYFYLGLTQSWITFFHVSHGWYYDIGLGINLNFVLKVI